MYYCSSKSKRWNRKNNHLCEFRDRTCQGRKKVLLVDADVQGSMAVSLGVREPDNLDHTIVNIMEKVINDEDVEPNEGIIWHDEGIAFIPAKSTSTPPDRLPNTPPMVLDAISSDCPFTLSSTAIVSFT